MNRQALNIALLLLGVAVLSAAVKGQYLRYVSPAMHWPLLVAGLVVVGLGVADIAADIRDLRAQTEHPERPAVSTGHHHAPHHPAPHDHLHGPRALTWLLALPVAVLLFAAPAAIPAGGFASADMAPSSVSAAREDRPREVFPPLPDEPAPAVGFLEIYRRADAGAGGGLAGRAVTVEGQVVAGGPVLRIGRVTIICCAADARTMSVRALDGPALAALGGMDDGQWVRAVVTVAPEPLVPENGYMPAASVLAVTPIPEPPNTYEIPRR